MSNRKGSPATGSTTALRTAAYAGVAAALVSIASALVLRSVPTLESVVAIVHLALTALFYTTAGALAARFGADGWRAGMFAGLVDAMIGHTVAYLLATPPDPSRTTLPAAVSQTAENLARMQAWGAVIGAVSTVFIALGAGALGAFLMRRSLSVAARRTPDAAR